MDLPDNLPILTYADSDGAHKVTLISATTSIGRQHDQDVVLRESCVSRRHAVINQLAHGFELVDQNSSHGTYVNGARIDRILLRSGDILQFGSTSAPQIHFRQGSVNREQSHPSLSNVLISAISRFSPSGNGESPVLREMAQLNFLISAARRLNSGGAKADILQALIQLSIQVTGVERGFVFLRDRDGMHPAMGLLANGDVVHDYSTLSRRAIRRSIESESKFSVSDTLADTNAASWDSVLANSIRCIYCIPLRKHVSAAEPDRLLGLLYLDSQLRTGHLSEIDHALLDTIATEAATLLDNALMAEAELKARQTAEELSIAARIHASLMPATLPSISYATVQARTVPCSEIGGDFYDALVLGDCLGAAIVDVSGKGVPASIVAAILQGIVHAQMLTGQGLADIAALVNRFLCTRDVGKYATMVLLKLYPDGRVDYINCGHIQPLLISECGVRPLEEANIIVGLIEGATYTSTQIQLIKGDRILLATDGITEAENETNEQFGDDRFLAAAHLERVDEILCRLTEFRKNYPTQDDYTLVNIRYNG
jgi:serine phosphatase RsbU (regulator of sigma subunit)/pSer/pThr/pTyr-binding forkhead associated (FHA) protein